MNWRKVIEEAAFYEAIRSETGLQLLDQEIRDAWNAPHT